MKSKGVKKFKRAQVNRPESRDKLRKIYDDFRAAEKKDKSKTPRAEIRSGTRAQRRVTKGILKQYEVKFNG